GRSTCETGAGVGAAVLIGQESTRECIRAPAFAFASKDQTALPAASRPGGRRPWMCGGFREGRMPSRKIPSSMNSRVCRVRRSVFLCFRFLCRLSKEMKSPKAKALDLATGPPEAKGADTKALAP